ncbi:long-chain fatty acid--CoA ligase [Mycobacterium sp. AZCC_0083]|uniref:AMP-dependent synthetase/ligase n=1 Tax=Mycobacterium sp. AZCC_0083 TaxID=2735882 RepID=UPI00160D6B58|nr:AMP-dependent synthetase/ligase [Mycobacterium sp. AZCC_0083]MBB5165352.1 long-subunit acyl-CoA synthetase (AMP-forming) [Mycobacterium sp. AZCC_0083]
MSAAVHRDTVTVGEAFLAMVEARADAPAILNADLEVVLSWRDYGAQARRTAAGLAELGLGQGETLGLLLSNRPEFHVADAGALLLGAIPFSMYNTSAPEQLAHLLADADCRIVITEATLVDGLLAALERGGSAVEHVIVVGSDSWFELLDSDELEHAAAVKPSDLVTLIYTSGTTGPPKGVELTHANILTMAAEIGALVGIQPGQRTISYLPMAHIAERVCTHYLPMTVGFSVVCCPSPSAVTQLLPRVRPHMFFSPPRLWEKLQASIAADVEAGIGHEELRRRLGFDELTAAVTGAAPCPPAVIEFFDAIGIPLREVYGLSETTGVVSLAAASDVRAGTVGPPLPSAQVRLAEDGELLVRGPLLMAGYHNRPEATAEAIDADGWLHTGDIARIEADGHLRIVDRKKELIINAAGKNMSPANIEARLKEGSPLIGQACAFGNERPYNVALIVLDPAIAVSYPTDAERQAEVRAGVDRANARLARVEQIKRFAILADEWLPDSDELTPTMKLKRRPITHKYASQIEALYTAKDTK